MVALFFVTMVLIFLGIDWLIQRKRNPHPAGQEMYYTSRVGLTMADGGEKIEKKCPHCGQKIQ